MADIVLIGWEGVEENLGMRSLAAFMAQRGVTTRVLSCDEFDVGRLVQLVQEEGPQIVGFSLVFQGYFSRLSQLIHSLRRNGVRSHFTLGGHLASVEPALCLTKIRGLDTVVRGEGELTLLELFRGVELPASWSGIKGLAYRRNGSVVLTPPRPLISDLDSLPFSLRKKPMVRFRDVGICPVLSSRGCFYDCAFCSIQSFYRICPGPQRRSRSPGNIADELYRLFEEDNVRVFIFRDDDLCTRGSLQRKWIDDFTRLLRRRQLDKKVFWRISCRIDEVDREVLLRLMDAGLGVLYLGIESGNEVGLKVLNKRYSVADIHRALDTLVDIGLPFDYGFMMFDPSSTLGSIRENLDMLVHIGRIGDVPIQFTKMIPYRGTPIANSLKRSGRLRGTIDSPTYGYKDERVRFVEYALGRIFESETNGKFQIAKELQGQKFATLLRRRFFPHENGTLKDMERVASRTAAYNREAAAEAVQALEAIDGVGPLPRALLEGFEIPCSRVQGGNSRVAELQGM